MNKKIAILLLLIGVLSSCQQHDIDDSTSSLSTLKINIILNTNTHSVPTYALTPSEECNIDDVYVFFFKKSTGRLYKVAEGMDVVNISNTSKSFYVTLQVSSSQNEELECHVVANVKHNSILANPSLLEGKLYTQIQTLLTESVKDKLHLTQGNFVMWGKSRSNLNTSSPNSNLNVSLVRSLARVDVGVGVKGNWNGKDSKGNIIPFKLREVYIYKPNNQYAYIPTEQAVTSFDYSGKKVTQHSAQGASLNSPFCYDSSHIQSELYIDKTIYLPEADIRLGGAGDIGDAHHTQRCAIIVGGEYAQMGILTYYRIDFNDNDGSQKKLIDVLRNHNYIVNIISVESPGLPTPDEAYTSIKSSLTVEITNWDDTSQDAVFDGSDWMFFEKKRLLLPGTKNVTGGLAISSSIDTDEWEMSLDGVTFTKDKTLANTTVEISKPTQKEGGVLKIKTLTNITNDQEILNLLTLKAKNLIYNVEITQVPDLIGDWDEGIEFPTDF